MPLIQRAAIVIVLLMLMLASVLESFAETINYTYDDSLQLTKAQYGDGTTVEYVYDNLGNRLIKTTALPGAPSNNPPISVSNPAPASATTDIATAPTLSWTGGGDPDAGDAVVYSVYLGTSPTDLSLVGSGPQASFQPGQLQALTTYYWQVMSKDSHNVTTTGPVWSFTTANTPPVASFTANKTAGWGPLEVTFLDSSQDTDGDAIASWAWDFNGDGIIDSTNRNPAHTYTAAGTYSVTLTVSDSHGASATKTMSAYVNVYDIDNPGPATLVQCVTNGSELQAALTLAQNDGKDNLIRLVQGTYYISQNNNKAFSYTSDEQHRLYMIGGYAAGCASRIYDSSNTILDGSNIYQGSYSKGGVLYLFNNYNYNTPLVGDGYIEANGLTIQNGKAYYGGGVYMAARNGTVILANSIVKNNTATSRAGGIYAWNVEGTVALTGNIIARNVAEYEHGGINVENSYWGKLYITNNTIADNTLNTLEGIGGGIYVTTDDSLNVVTMQNNIIWNNTGDSEIYLDNLWKGAGAVNAYNNDFDPTKMRGVFANSSSNISADPQFVNAAGGDYRLLSFSLARDAGNNSATFLTQTDPWGSARVVGTAVDIGAAEYTEEAAVPPRGSISVNNGTVYTRSTSVTLTLSANDPNGVSQMCLSNTDNCTGWEAYSTIKAWTIPAGDGPKTVYAWFKDNLGNANPQPYSAIITLDTVTNNHAPVASFTVNQSAGWAPFSAFFSDTSQDPDGDAIVSWAWDFNGDGIIDSYERNSKFSYVTGGSYTVSLTVTDELGLTSTMTVTGFMTVYDAEHVDGNTVIHCVNTSGDLQNALTEAEANGKSDVIKMVQGTYVPGFYHESGEPFSLIIRGGYSPGCNARVADPSSTIIDGTNVNGYVLLSIVNYAISPATSIVVEGLTVKNANSNTSMNRVIDLWSDNGQVALIGSRITNNNTKYYPAVKIGTLSGKIMVINNVIADNSVVTNVNYDKLGLDAYAFNGEIDIINNTVSNNSSLSNSYPSGLYISSEYYTSITNLYNNILLNNSFKDIHISGSSDGTINAYNNIFDPIRVDGSLTNQGNNIDADPMFVNSASGDYSLASGSPARDTGSNLAPFLSTTDIAGNARIWGAVVDMGAFEYTPDNSPPNGSIVINNGASSTNTPSVILTLSATDQTGVSQMCISNTVDCSAWETYSTSKNWTLSDGDGVKTVYVWYKDSLGNSNPSPFTASIILSQATNSTLSVLFSGTGSGMVTSTPSGIACNTNCSAQFSTGTPVTLHSAASQYSLFAGWTDGVCSGTGDCPLTLNADTSVTAAFAYDVTHQVQVDTGSPTYYSSIQSAYDAITDGATIKLWATTYNESLSCSLPVTVTIQGGYNDTYTTIVGETTLTGALIIIDGTLIADGLGIQ